MIISRNFPLGTRSISFWLISMVIIVSCQPFQPDEHNDKTTQLLDSPTPLATWNVGILIMDGVYNTELTAPMDIFHHTVFHHDLGMKVFTIADSKAPIRTFEGLNILADYNYLTDSLPPIHVLVVPSAEHHLDTDLENETLIQFVREAGKNANYVMSLCDGAFVLAKAGLLDDSESTTFPGDIDAYKKMFPHLTVHKDLLFVHDGKFITSAGGAKSFEPALYLSELLYGKKAADGIAKGMVIDWNLDEVPKVIVKKN